MRAQGTGWIYPIPIVTTVPVILPSKYKAFTKMLEELIADRNLLERSTRPEVLRHAILLWLIRAEQDAVRETHSYQKQPKTRKQQQPYCYQPRNESDIIDQILRCQKYSQRSWAVIASTLLFLLYHFPKVITSTISLNEKVCRKGIKNIITVRVQGKKDNICLYKKMEGWVDRWINEPVRIVLAVQAGKKTLQ